MNPLSLKVLVVTTKAPSGTGVRTFVDTSETLLRELGDQLVQDKPAEVTHISFVVLPAEGVS
jgi:hypothetical protein